MHFISHNKLNYGTTNKTGQKKNIIEDAIVEKEKQKRKQDRYNFGWQESLTNLRKIAQPKLNQEETT